MFVSYMLDEGAFKPEKAHKEDAGFDVRTPMDVTVPANGSAFISTGVHVDFPVNFCCLVVQKSGLNSKHDLACMGLIDSGYHGSIGVHMINHGDEAYTFAAGDKIAQLLFLPTPDVVLVSVDKFSNSVRGNNGFGSTGR